MSKPSDFIIENEQEKGLVILRDYKGKDEEVRIPDGITAIGTGAFSDIRRSIRVIIPDSVTRIGGFAFTGCSGLISVVIPGSVKKIPIQAFSDCGKLEEVTICEGVEALDGEAFANCKRLKKLSIPASVKTLGRANASSLYKGPFIGCKNLEEVVLSEGLTSLERKAFEGCVNLKRVTIPDSVTTIDKDFLPKDSKVNINVSAPSKLPAVWRPNAAVCFAEDGGRKSDPRFRTHCKYIKSNDEKLVTVAMDHPALLELMCREKLITAKSINLYAVAAKKAGNADCISRIDRYIKDNLDGECPSTDFVIKNGVLIEYLGPGGDVVIPEGVTEIGKEVFAKSKTLTGVTFPKSLKTVGVEAFARCDGLKSVTIPRDVTEIWLCAFDWCKNLKDVYIDDLVAWCRIKFGGFYANCGNPLSAVARLHVNDKALTELVIPEDVENIGNYTFFRCAGLESVVIPEGVTSIGEYAFFECTNLKSISLPDGLTSIGEGAFLRCKKLTGVKIPKTVTSIGDRAFMDCRKLTDLILPEGVELLGDQAFGGCGQLKVSLPGSLKRPKADMFGRLREKAPFTGSACSIRIEKWSVLITKMMDGCTIEEIITTNYALIPGEILLPVAIKMTAKMGWDPASETGKALLAALSKNAGKLCSLAVTNPAWLQLLCDNRLIKAKDLDGYLDEAEKQENTEIKAMLLDYQNELGSTEVEKARTKKEKEKEAYTEALAERTAARDPSKGIEGMTFVITGQLKAWPKVWSSREEVEAYLAPYGAKLGASLTKETDYLVTNDADSGSAKNEKAGELGVEVITEEKFNQMIGRRFIDAETVHVPAWVKTIEPAAFSFPDWANWKMSGYKKLKEVELPEGLRAIGEKAFAGAEKLEKIDIPGSVTDISAWAFAGCSALTEITLPDKLQTIAPCAFDGCTALTKLVLPDGVKEIGLGAFRDCSDLEEIDLPTSVVQIELMAFDGCPKLTIHAQAGSYAAGYARRNGLSLSVIGEESAPEAGGSDDFVIENGVLTQYLGDGGDVTIPEGVTEIASTAFFGCQSLTSVSIPKGVRKISFSNCSNLSSINIPNSVTGFGYGDFFNCSSLAELTIPESVTQIGKQAFYNCSSLKKLVIPGSVKELEEEVFSNCSALETIVFSEGVETLGKNEFFSCSSLRDVYLPASLQKIGRANYFFRCTIHAPAKSYAQKYAKSHKIAFAVWETE